MVFSEYRCPPLPHIEAASAVNNPINATVGNTEEVVCDEGFIFAATMTSRVLECGNDKQWRGNMDACGRKSRTIVWRPLEVSLHKLCYMFLISYSNCVRSHRNTRSRTSEHDQHQLRNARSHRVRPRLHHDVTASLLHCGHVSVGPAVERRPMASALRV